MTELRFGFESARFRLGSASLTPSPSSARRLSIGDNPILRGCYNNKFAANRRLSFMSLQGWPTDAEEATSARAIKGGLEPAQAAAWELFTPIQRILFVAIISVAASESRKNDVIAQLKKSVEFRDQVLSNMQHKLDRLCAQISNIKDHQKTETSVKTPKKDIEMLSDDPFGCDKIKSVDCSCCLCDQHCEVSHGLESTHDMKGSSGYEILQYKMSIDNVAEQEERRMSDLSDMASSITSATDFQLNSLAIEQEMYNLKKTGEVKDGTIRELTSLLHSSETADSKRIAHLEDIIRRKNSTITKLKMDMAVLEQKVVHYARQKRSSYCSLLSSDDSDSADPLPKVPQMADNLLYDMDSSTSPSDSDSASPVNRTCQKLSPKKASTFDPLNSRCTSVAPLKEISLNSRHLQLVNTKSQTVSLRRQSMSPRSGPTSPLSPFSKGPQTETLSSRSESPLFPLLRKYQSTSAFKKPSTSQTSRPRQLSAGGDSKISKRRSLLLKKESKIATPPQKRWA